MAYDTELAERVGELLATTPDVTETRMFGGLAFLVCGHMTVTASGQGGLLVRIDPGRTDELTGSDGVEVAVMRGRAMPGWLRVPSERLGTRRQLVRWIDLALAHVATLPDKRPRTSGRTST